MSDFKVKFNCDKCAFNSEVCLSVYFQCNIVQFHEYTSYIFKMLMKCDGVPPSQPGVCVAFRAQRYQVHGKLRTANVIMQIMHA